jgi:hypothetical protein
MVITRKDYLDAYSGGFLMNWLRTNLIQKSFLFVGYSLSDFDIVNLIKEAKATLPSNVSFGPHFAILDRKETSQAHRKYLRKCYQIRTIVDDIRGNPDVLRQLFAYIHGMSALRRAQAGSPTGRPPETLNSVVDTIAAAIRTDIGCDYIGIYVTDGIDKIALNCLCQCVGMETRIHSPHRKFDEPTQDLRRLFLSMRDNNYYYTPHASPEVLAGYSILESKGNRIKSVLVMPVSSQGKKIGLLVAGSVIEGAFTSYHYEALAIHTKTLSESCKSLLGKLNVVQTAQHGLLFEDIIHSLSTSRLLASLIESGQMRCILYAADYVQGRLVPYYNPPPGQSDTRWSPLPVGEHFLACDALSRGVTLHFQSAEEAMEYMRSSHIVKRGLDYFGVVGNIYLTPIRSNGHISAVLVCWDNSCRDKKRYTQFERAKRIVRVMLNNYSVAEGAEKPSGLLLRTLDEALKEYDNGDAATWATALRDRNEHFMRGVIQNCLSAAASAATGLTRTRLWVAAGAKGLRDIERQRRSQQIEFVIKHSYSLPSCTRPGDAHLDKYVRASSMADDEYTQNTLDRYGSDPYARVIDPLSTGKPVKDKNADHLEKDESGFWLTVPLVYRDTLSHSRKLHLMGFLSADSHCYVEAVDKYVKSGVRLDSAQVAFQRCALDLVAHLIAPLVRGLYFHQDPIFGA